MIKKVLIIMSVVLLICSPVFAEDLMIDDNGLKIGQVNSVFKLAIYNPTEYGAIEVVNEYDNRYFGVWQGDGHGRIGVYDIDGNPEIHLYAGGQDSYISGGNLGVGTKHPKSSLHVLGYTQLDLTSGVPPSGDCDETTEYGRMKVDSNGNGTLYICVENGWVGK